MPKYRTTWETAEVKNLLETILELKTISEARCFFRDLLTEPELIEFSKRWTAAKMLSDRVAYEKIIEETGLSSTTVARISKWLHQGMDGYKLMINRTHHRASSSKKRPR